MQVTKVDVVKGVRGLNFKWALSRFKECTLVLFGYLSSNCRALFIGCGNEFEVSR